MKRDITEHDTTERLRTIREAFTGSDATRRDFLRASAGVGATLSLPGAAAAQAAEDAEVTVPEQYRFVYEHTPAEETIPTLIEFESEDGLDELDALDADARTTTDPTAAAYARLSPEQVGTILASGEERALPSATRLRYSPGSNPFWRLDYYPEGVFPAPEESVDYIAYEQALDGLRHLETEHSDTLSLRSVGESPGWYNVMDFEVAPQELLVAEVTNDVNDGASFEDKEKVLYSLSIHGDERSGAETGSRVIEDVLEGHNEELASLLDDLVLVFLYPNPDGWVARSPEYFSGDRVTDSDLVRVDAFRRYTGTLRDMNRQWPTVGYIDPTHYPAEPNGSDLQNNRPGIDADVPVQYEKYVPGALDIAESLREYNNLNYGADLHGMFDEEEFVLGLIMNTEYNVEELHDLYELNQYLDDNVTERIGPLLEEYSDHWEELATEIEEWYASFGEEDYDAATPTEAFSYGTIFDTIDYTTTGTFASWFAQPEELGGLDLVTMSPEMAFDNRVGEEQEFRPKTVETQVAAYEAFIETMATQATREITAEIDTADARTAYVRTDALRRSSDSLSFAETSMDDRSESVTVPPGRSESLTVTVEEGARVRVGIDPREGSLANASLLDPAGEVANTYSPSGTRGPRGTVWTLQDASGGEWTIEASNENGRQAASVEVTIGVLRTNGEGPPDPEAALGYQQRDYEVTPFAFFEEYATYLDDSDSLAEVSIRDVSSGGLLDGSTPAFENVVVIHDQGADDADYVGALEEYVAAGGNLVLTDSGVAHLGGMDGPAAEIGADAVSEETFVVPYLGAKNPDHPLLGDVREIQRELWKVAPLGYTIGDAAPMTLVGVDAFGDAEGTIAATTDGLVSAGTLGGESEERGSVQVIASLLRPATQANLHPFGLHDYSVSFLGQTVLSNALGYQQERFVDGEAVETFERGDGAVPPGEPPTTENDEGGDGRYVE
jgi:hypothetical protein